MERKLIKRVQFLQAYSLVLTAILAAMVLTGFVSRNNTKMDQLDVGRINVVEKDGRVRMVISNKELAPDPVLGGKTYPMRSGGNQAGIIFFNDVGDECGGLAYGVKQKDGKYAAGSQLAFDQFNQDQTVGIQYSEENGNRFAGLKVWDRGETPASEIVDKMTAAKAMKEGPEKARVMKEIEESVKRGEYGALRIVVGKRDPEKTAEIMLADAAGKPRLKLSVNVAGAPKLEFLDADGKVFYSLPQK